MRGVIKKDHGEGHVELSEAPMPVIGVDEVLIKCKIAPIGSDVRVYKGDPVMSKAVQPPVILGSENSGEIVEVGKNVKNWKIGDRVVSELIASSCGQCELCKTGKAFRCNKVTVLGRGQNGTFADFFKVQSQFLHRIPENVSFENASMAEDLGVCLSVLSEHRVVNLEDNVAILGPGPMGLLSLQVSKKCGAGKILVTGAEQDKKRLSMAQEMGADHILEIGKESTEEAVDDITKGEGMDVVVLATGAAPAIAQALNIVKKYGTIVVIGFPQGSVTVPWQNVASKTPKILGAWGASGWQDWERALRCISSESINVAKLITHKFGLEDWKKAFDTFDSAEGVKVVLVP